VTAARVETRRVELKPFQIRQIPELMRWFPDERSCRTWGGVEFRFPFTATSFREDAMVDKLPSWALVTADGGFVGFGQNYLRVGRCHLGRLAIAPNSRGQGLGTTLVTELCARGRAEFGATSCSLFVVPENRRAMTLYERLGFAATPYPEPSPELGAYVYMVTS
jgi:ribosomal protein S18 acetylase RimI-like enzyme